jgi:hypothetical protein
MRVGNPPIYPPFLLRVPRARGCVFAPTRARCCRLYVRMPVLS